MGFSSEVLLVSKEKNNAIEIYSSDTEENSNIQSFSIEYLFNHLISDILDVNFDISKITVLELSKCNLTDLPGDCKKLNLKYLGLSHNNLERVPTCLYTGLEQLESLDLSYNLIENFDMEPSCLTRVKKMMLNNNKFINVPKWFLMFRCISMEEFNYSNNKANHYNYMKNSWVGLLKLKKLKLINSCLIDKDFGLLKCFKQLEYLNISNSTSTHTNRFDDLDQLFVKPKWKELNVLKLNDLSLSIFPEGIAWMLSLKELHVSDNNLSWLPDDIEYLANLEVLIVSNNCLVSLPKGLMTMEKLRILQASNNCIDGVPDFSPMLNLKTLDLFNNSLGTVSVNVNNVDFVDLEYNYCDTREFVNTSLYEEKKNSLRKEYAVEGRYDGPKTRKCEDLSDSCSKSDLKYDSDYEPDVTKVVVGDDNENWDLPSEIKKTHSDIDSEDDKWQGAEIKPYVKSSLETKRIYVSDDDWMFEDCGDS